MARWVASHGFEIGELVGTVDTLRATIFWFFAALAPIITALSLIMWDIRDSVVDNKLKITEIDKRGEPPQDLLIKLIEVLVLGDNFHGQFNELKITEIGKRGEPSQDLFIELIGVLVLDDNFHGQFTDRGSGEGEG